MIVNKNEIENYIEMLEKSKIEMIQSIIHELDFMGADKRYIDIAIKSHPAIINLNFSLIEAHRRKTNIKLHAN